MIQGNYVGVTASGNAALSSGNGILVINSTGNVVGGAVPGAGNVVSGHSGDGINVQGADGTTIQGNLVGTNAAGNAALPNNFGIDVVNSNNPTIGGGTPQAGNVVSGNTGIGLILNNQVAGALVQGNRIGVAADGVTPLPNGSVGILLNTQSTTDGIFGGAAAGAANVIAYNGGQGIWNLGLRNRFERNSIHSNATLGIDNAGAGVTPNDPGDVDTGSGNDEQNFPVLTGAFRGTSDLTVEGTLNSLPNGTYRLEFFTSDLCDSSLHGEGQAFLGSTDVVTDGAGNAVFSTTLPAPTGARQRLTATATDSTGNTSEFSACIAIAAQFFTLQPCRVADTRLPDGPLGGPILVANGDRIFPIVNTCNIPPTAQAVAFNFTVAQAVGAGDFRVVPAGQPFPLVSTLNFGAGQTRANNAIVSLGPNGDIAVRCAAGPTHFVIDITGYLE